MDHARCPHSATRRMDWSRPLEPPLHVHETGAISGSRLILMEFVVKVTQNSTLLRAMAWSNRPALWRDWRVARRLGFLRMLLNQIAGMNSNRRSRTQYWKYRTTVTTLPMKPQRRIGGRHHCCRSRRGGQGSPSQLYLSPLCDRCSDWLYSGIALSCCPLAWRLLASVVAGPESRPRQSSVLCGLLLRLWIGEWRKHE